MEAIRIEINDRRKVFAVRELFSHAFPGLKLEFYAKPHTEDGPHSDKIVRNSNVTIADCRTVDRNGFLTVEPGMTAEDLKSFLRDVFGLEVEIYKRDASNWEKVNSDGRSLAELSDVAR